MYIMINNVPYSTGYICSLTLVQSQIGSLCVQAHITLYLGVQCSIGTGVQDNLFSKNIYIFFQSVYQPTEIMSFEFSYFLNMSLVRHFVLFILTMTRSFADHTFMYEIGFTLRTTMLLRTFSTCFKTNMCTFSPMNFI